jgi:hypothetical protein
MKSIGVPGWECDSPAQRRCDACSIHHKTHWPYANAHMQMMSQVYTLHRKDPNFPITIINRIKEFLGMPLFYFQCLHLKYCAWTNVRRR